MPLGPQQNNIGHRPTRRCLAGLAFAIICGACGKEIESSSVSHSTNVSPSAAAAISQASSGSNALTVQAREPANHDQNQNIVSQPQAVPTRIALQTSASNEVERLPAGFEQSVFAAQVALVRHGISPGSIDGLMGPQTRAALRAFQQGANLPANGALDAKTAAELGTNRPPLVTCTISETDLARLQPLGKTWLAKSEQNRLDYETILELVAEKCQAHPTLIRRLNPGIAWEAVAEGTPVYVPEVSFPTASRKAALLRIFLTERTLEAFDMDNNLLAHFPCSIAQRVEKRPVGELHIAVIAPNPNYTFDPEVFPESAEARELNRKLILQPGPNNPVGTVWIGLDKAGYGIHGTPRPEDVGRTESHGCFRLANWNAEYLLKLIDLGTPVKIE